MKIFTGCFLAATVFTLAACATIDQSAFKSTAIPAVSESASQICRAASENNVRANSLYANKIFSATGEVRSVNEGFQPRYRIYLRSGNIGIHAGTDNKNAATQLTVGKTERVSGVITNVSTDFNGCSISLKNATF